MLLRPDPTFSAALGASSFTPTHRALREQLAEAGRRGDFATVLGLLEQGDVSASMWRVGGTSWFTPLHQAAWHGVTPEIAERIRGFGGFLLQPDAKGRTPADVARERGHKRLAEALTPEQHKSLAREAALALQANLHGVMLQRASVIPDLQLRPVPVQILTELVGEAPLWCPVPGMYGGFALRLRQGYIESSSWSRVVGGSGQLHLVTTTGVTLADEGFG